MSSNKVSPSVEDHKKRHPLVIYNLAICATIGGALFGYDTGIINGANLLIKEEWGLSDNMIEHIVSSAVGAAALFSLASGVIADCIGRKASIMVSAIVFTVGGFLMGLAANAMMLLIGRITVGAAIGVVSSIVPIYVSECAPPDIRGCLITMNQLFITLGIWLSSILAAVFQSLDNGWRYMLGLAAVPGIIQFICFLALPESPRWHVIKNNEEKARSILKRIRASDDVEKELQAIVTSLEEEKKTKGWKIWKGIFTTPHVRYALFLGCMLQFFQQFCGINTVIYYSANILKSAGFDVKLAIWLSVIPFTVNFLATFIGLWAVEALGRTKVLAVSFLAIAVALWVLVAAFLPVYLNPPKTSSIYEKSLMDMTDSCLKYENCWDCVGNSDCSFCSLKGNEEAAVNGSCVPKGNEKDVELYSTKGRCAKEKDKDQFVGGKKMQYAYGYCPSKYSWLAVLGLMLFVLGFAPGAGPMPWTINAEIYPLWCRSVANSLATVTNWGSNYLVSNLFLTMTKTITTWGTFLFFSVVCIVGALFVLGLVPETKDRSLEEIELLFMTKAAREAVQARKGSKSEIRRGSKSDTRKGSQSEIRKGSKTEM